MARGTVYAKQSKTVKMLRLVRKEASECACVFYNPRRKIGFCWILIYVMKILFSQ